MDYLTTPITCGTNSPLIRSKERLTSAIPYVQRISNLEYDTPLYWPGLWLLPKILLSQGATIELHDNVINQIK